MENKPLVSVIIPVVKVNYYLEEAIDKILRLNWSNFEVIIFIDQKDKKHHWPKTRIIASAKIGPAEKRDLALKYAKGEILAFLDDDAYPKKDWLIEAVKNFRDKKVAAVGGPAITPPHDSLWQKVSGAVSASYFGGGGARNRFLPTGKTREVDDWPTVNLLVRKDIFKKIGGFDSTYWPGEDTKLCLDIINAGYKIIYDPKTIVYHHRRSNLIAYFKQIGNYGLHRGYFAKRYPKTSFKFWYFVPTLFVLYLISLVIWPNRFYRLPLWLYFIGLLIDGAIISICWKNILIGLLTIPMIFLTHLWYGIRFVWGLLLTKLKR